MIWEEIYGANHPAVANVSWRLAKLLRDSGDTQAAEAMLRDTLRILQSLPEQPPLTGWNVHLNLAQILNNRGEFNEAIEHYQAALAFLRESPADERALELQTLEHLYIALASTERSAEIETVVKELYAESQRFHPPGSIPLAVTATMVGVHLSETGRTGEAEEYLREAIKIYRGSDQKPRILMITTMDRLFQVIRRRSDPESQIESDELLAEILEHARDYWGPEHLSENLLYLVGRLEQRGLFVAALRSATEVLQLALDNDMERVIPRITGATARYALEIAFVRNRPVEDYHNALEAAERALALAPESAEYLTVLGACRVRLGRDEEALDAFEAARLPMRGRDALPSTLMNPVHDAFRALAWHRLGATSEASEAFERMTTARSGASNHAIAGALFREVERTLTGDE